MKLFLITTAMSTTWAVIMIIALLVVSCIIGIITAWFYAKSIYTPIIKGLENDKVQLNKEISGLKDNISELNNRIDNLNVKIKSLDEEISQKGKEISEKEKTIAEMGNVINELKRQVKV